MTERAESRSNGVTPPIRGRLSGQLTPREARRVIESVTIAQEHATAVHKDLLRASAHGRVQQLRLLIADPALNINSVTSHARMTALHYAASRGHLEAVRLLLTAGADLSLEENQGRTALALALEARHVTIAQLLLSWPARPARFDSRRNIHYRKGLNSASDDAFLNKSNDSHPTHTGVAPSANPSVSMATGNRTYQRVHSPLSTSPSKEVPQNVPGAEKPYMETFEGSGVEDTPHSPLTWSLSMVTNDAPGSGINTTRPIPAVLETLAMNPHSSVASEDESEDANSKFASSILHKQNSMVTMKLLLKGTHSDGLLVSVMTPRLVGPWYDKYVEYLVEITHPALNKKFKVYRRFSDFLALHAMMERRLREGAMGIQHSIEKLHTLHSLRPQKYAFKSRNDPGLLEERMAIFSSLLHYGISEPCLNPLVIDFILKERQNIANRNMEKVKATQRRNSFSVKKKKNAQQDSDSNDNSNTSTNSNSNNSMNAVLRNVSTYDPLSKRRPLTEPGSMQSIHSAELASQARRALHEGVIKSKSFIGLRRTPMFVQPDPPVPSGGRNTSPTHFSHNGTLTQSTTSINVHSLTETTPMSTIRSGTTDTDTVSEGIVNVRGNTADTAPVGRVIWSSGGESPTNIASINLTTTASDNQISTRAQDTHARLLVSQSSLVNGVIRGSSSPRLMAYGAVGSEKGMERYRTDTQHNYAGLAERSTSNRSVASLGNESQIPTQYMDSEITEAVDTTAYTNQHESYRPNESQTQMLTQPRNSPYQTYTTKSTQRNNRSSSLVDLISTFTPARSPRPSKILPTVSKVTGQKTRPQVDEDQGDE